MSTTVPLALLNFPEGILFNRAGHSEETPGNIVKQHAVTKKGRVSCEVNSIGATGAKPPLPGRTTICIGVKTNQSAQN
ncbi:MAG: hypothetical protein LJE89_00790 [Deltaproteobacteria bacterium]|nr:hypothetical protein [Deltaproteobacteria bacterium]